VDVMVIHDSISIKSPLGEGGRDMTEGNNPTDRSNLGQAKRQILTDKKGIPLSTVITSANEHDIKAVTVAIYNAVIELPAAVTTFLSKTKTKRTIRR
jgi:IS5 family transposase